MRYKQQLRRRIEQYRESHPNVTLGSLAANLSIEPSYLSRFLGDSQTHFSDDLLYRLAKKLKLSESDIDTLFLYREYDRATQPDRKKYLEMKLRSECLRKWNPELDKLREQLLELLRVVDLVNNAAEKCR